MRKLPKIIIILLLIAAVVLTFGCAQKRSTQVNETVSPINKTIAPMNETITPIKEPVAPVNKSVLKANASSGTSPEETVNESNKTHKRNHSTSTTTENNTTGDNVTTTTQTVNISDHSHSTKIVSLKVTPTNPTVFPGQTQQFTASGAFSDSSIRDITDMAIWSSSNTTVASISGSGLATSKSIGITQINATYDGVGSADQTLTVAEVKLVSIEVFPIKPTIHLGQTQKFTAIGTYSDGNMKDITAKATWLSSNTTVSNISASGLASSKSLGTTHINATCDGISSPTQRLNVIDAKLEFVIVSPQNPNITLNQTQQFRVNGTYSDGSIKDITAFVTWSSSNTTVANISASGLATPSTAGTTQINATNYDIECIYPQLNILSQTLMVTDAKLISIAITPENSTIDLHNTQQFKANGTYSDGSIIDITAIVNWSSSNTTVASINESGLAMPVFPGTTQINATMGEISSPDQTLTVHEITPGNLARLISIEISPVNPTVNLGKNQQFIAYGTYSNGSIKDITDNVTWSSSNTSVASINTSGLATSTSLGTTLINASYNGISSTDQTLTVTDAKLISIAVTPDNQFVDVNQTLQFKATGTYSDGSIKDITSIVNWSSRNTIIASINESGLALALSPGTTHINAAIGEISSPDQRLGVNEPKPNNTNVIRLISIEISPVNPTVSLGQTQQFIANGIYSDGSIKDITANVTWASSNTTVASINTSGLATSTSFGTTQINASYNGISSTDQTLTVIDAKLISIKVTPLDPIITLDETQQFIANGNYSDGSIKDISSIVNWSSGNTSVANISASGLATPSSLGDTQINASIGEIRSPDQTLKVIEPQHNNTNVTRLILIEISPVNPTIFMGKNEQFIANGTYSDGSKKDITINVTWSSSNTTVASINDSGLATSTSLGTTQINATSEGISSTDQTLTVIEAKSNVTVNDTKLVSITVTPVNPTVSLGQTQQFIANGTYSDGSTKDITDTVIWSSSNATVASINASGLATSTSLGTTQINATSEGISSTDQTLTVTEAILVSITVSPINSTVSLGQTQQFNATGTYSDGSTKDITDKVTWLSNNATVASINASGLATTASIGITQINATSEGINSTDQTLTVTEAKLVYITVTPLNSTVSLGQTQQFNATGIYSDGSLKDITSTVTWSTSNNIVASINASGLATTASRGITQINATSEGISSTDQALTVTEATLVSITVTPLNSTVALGQTQQFIANGTYSDGSTKNITDAVIWSSSNATVASINASGLATSTSLGTTQINATSEGISSTDQTLTVTEAILVSINVTPVNSTVSLGQTQQFIANGTYSDGSTMDITSTVAWLSSNTTVASINASGLATSTSLGITQVNATSEGISSTDQTLTVTDAKLISIIISPVNSTVALGQTQQFIANGTYSDGSTKDITSTVAWSSSNTTVASINASGMATSAFIGITKINASKDGISSTDQTLTVTEAKLVSISVTPLNPTVSQGQTQQFIANGTYSDGSKKDITATATWLSSNTTVADISDSGLATSSSTGITKINASKDGINSPDQTLTVTAKLVSIIVSPLNPTISLNQTQQFIAIGIYSDGSTKDITETAIWSSSNLTIASINATGLAKPKSVGTTYISATSNGISSSYNSLKVTDGFDITLVPYMDSKYKYKIVNHGERAGFENVNYDDSDFSIGNASFGFIEPGYCEIYSTKYIKTLWPQNTDILLRKEFVLPAGVTNLKVNITVDNDVQVFINGHDVSNGVQLHEGCASWDYFEFSVDDSILKTGTNLLAVRGNDHSGVNFLDAKITADLKDHPVVDIKKFTNGKDANEAPGPLVSPGTIVTWTYAISNIGKVNITQSNISVTDSDSTVIPIYIGGDIKDDDNMEPGETWVYIAYGIAKEDQYTNIGRATIYYNGTELYYEDPSHYYGKK